ncbi:hypothetical protein [Actinomadura madurae]|uniref:hypothetical protein n=1 Tax=Actinomadura madurae TaxID=1993 RepID=UPI0011602674|nr:hypothetical protein [Actinomadura madurae]
MSDREEHPARERPTLEQLREETLQAGGVFMPEHRPGDDPLWDGLGTDWQMVEGILDVPLYVRLERVPDEHRRVRITGLCIADGPITADVLRAIPMGRLEHVMSRIGRRGGTQTLVELPSLVRDRKTDPDEFAARVAQWYEAALAVTSKPAKAIAERNNVPVTTVRGWIREARLRGKLPPGTKGKAG